MKTIIVAFLISIQLSFAAELSVMTFNVENLFDTFDDPDYLDEEFTPYGRANWTEEKLDWKLRNLSEVLLSVKNPDGTPCPDVLGLVEVENRFILEHWTKNYIPQCKYEHIAIYDHDPRDPINDDIRGIKTALISKNAFTVAPQPIPVYRGGRFIQVAQVYAHGYPITFFVNHWKSRIGSGEDKRILAAETLKEHLRELNYSNPLADIVVMGDFNDEPEDDSMNEHLKISSSPAEMFEDFQEPNLWNTSFERFYMPFLLEHAQFLISQGSGHELHEVEDEIRKRRATYYYHKGRDFLQLDHILLSRGLFDSQGFSYKDKSFEIIRHEKFTTPEGFPIPFKPTREGAVGGASDHFPVLIRLTVNK